MARVSVQLLPGGKLKEVEAESVRELLAKLGFSTETHVVLRNGQPLVENEKLRDGDRLVVVRVLSGG